MGWRHCALRGRLRHVGAQIDVHPAPHKGLLRFARLADMPGASDRRRAVSRGGIAPPPRRLFHVIETERPADRERRQKRSSDARKWRPPSFCDAQNNRDEDVRSRARDVRRAVVWSRPGPRRSTSSVIQTPSSGRLAPAPGVATSPSWHWRWRQGRWQPSAIGGRSWYRRRRVGLVELDVAAAGPAGA